MKLTWAVALLAVAGAALGGCGGTWRTRSVAVVAETDARPPATAVPPAGATVPASQVRHADAERPEPTERGPDIHEVTYIVSGVLPMQYHQDTPSSVTVGASQDVPINYARPLGGDPKSTISDSVTEHLTGSPPWTKTVRMASGCWATLGTGEFEGTLSLQIQVDGRTVSQRSAQGHLQALECDKYQLGGGHAEATDPARPAGAPMAVEPTRVPREIVTNRRQPPTNPSDRALLRQYGY